MNYSYQTKQNSKKEIKLTSRIAIQLFTVLLILLFNILIKYSNTTISNSMATNLKNYFYTDYSKDVYSLCLEAKPKLEDFWASLAKSKTSEIVPKNVTIPTSVPKK